MADFTITLSDVELKALEYIAYDANDWIQNAIHERCRLAIDELVQTEIQTKLAAGEAVSGTKDEIVLNSTLPSAKERHDAMVLQMKASQAMYEANTA